MGIRNSLWLMILCVVIVACEGPNNSQAVNDDHLSVDTVSASEIMYDSVLAKSIGADEYGMKKYVMAFLKKGPNRDLDSVKAVELQRAHLDNITRMAEEGKLVLAGPFFGDGDIRGIYVFNVSTIEEAKALTESDPAIQEGSLIMDLKEWYGSAALVQVNDLHKKIAKINI